MRSHPTLLSRRACLAGVAAWIGCGGATLEAPNASLVGAAASQHWSVRYTGMPPEAMFVRRGDLASSHTALFWPGFLDDNIPGVPSGARQTEAFSYPAGSPLTVLRGVPPDSAPRPGAFALTGRAPSGVAQFRYLGGDVVLLALPGGVWIYGSGEPIARLADALATDPRPPPDGALEPWASGVQQDVGHDHLKRKGMLPLGLAGRDGVLARTVAVLAQRTVVKFHFQSAAEASDAAASVRQLLATGAARDFRWSANEYGERTPLSGFMQNVNDARADGAALVLSG